MQAVRLYEMTDDPGVRDHLSYMIARDTMHQNQWLAAIEDLQSEGFEETVVPKAAYEYGKKEAAYQFWNNSEGGESAQGRWAKGPSMDGKGQFEYVANPQPIGPQPEPPQPDPRLHGTPKSQAMQQASEAHAKQQTSDGGNNPLQSISETVGDVGETIKRTIIGPE